MYELFSDRAQKVMQLANMEAQQYNHEYIGTEHILLGLMKGGSGMAINVLKNLDVDIQRVRPEIEKIVRRGLEGVTKGKLAQTPRAKKVIELAMEESRGLGHSHVGTEHLLLGLMREEGGVASIVLCGLGLTVERVRKEVRLIIGSRGVALGKGLSGEGFFEVQRAQQSSHFPTQLFCVELYRPDELKQGFNVFASSVELRSDVIEVVQVVAAQVLPGKAIDGILLGCVQWPHPGIPHELIDDVTGAVAHVIGKLAAGQSRWDSAGSYDRVQVYGELQ